MKIGNFRLGDKGENFKVRVLPCRISYDGETDTEGYLPDENDCSLFGRILNGTKVDVGEKVLGLVANGMNDLAVSGKFEEVMYWNWDKEVDSTDQFQMLIGHVGVMNLLADS